jgi:hypothetical protein
MKLIFLKVILSLKAFFENPKILAYFLAAVLDRPAEEIQELAV